MKIRNKYLRGLAGISGAFLFIALLFVLAVITSAALVICKIVPEESFNGLVMAAFLVTVSINFGLIFIDYLKPEEKKPSEKCPDLHADNYHPECWDEKELER